MLRSPKQYLALLNTEQVHLDFRPDGVTRLAEIAFAVNEKTENIGARRLYTVMERLLEELSYEATTFAGQQITIDAEYVDQRLGELSKVKISHATFCSASRDGVTIGRSRALDLHHFCRHQSG